MTAARLQPVLEIAEVVGRHGMSARMRSFPLQVVAASNARVRASRARAPLEREVRPFTVGAPTPWQAVDSRGTQVPSLASDG